MKSQSTPTQFFLLAGLGLVMTLLTVILGAPFVRVLHKASRPLYFWAFGLVVVMGFGIASAPPAILALFASVWFMIGSYGELEKRGVDWRWSGLVSLVLSSLILIGGLSYNLWIKDINTWERYVMFISELFAGVMSGKPAMKIDMNVIAEQTPSMLVSLLIMGLGNALIFERKAASLFSAHYEKIASQLRLHEFRLPEAVVFAFLFSLFFSMVNFNVAWVSIVGFNLVNIGVVLLFFQGLAVLEVLFIVAKTSVFFRVLTYLILVGYLFVLLSLVGLVDYWADFRRRLRRAQAAEIG